MAQFEKTFEVRVPVERAWSAFTQPQELERWYADHVETLELRPGGRLAYGAEEYTIEGSYRVVEPNQCISWTEGAGLLPGETEVTVTFQAHEGGTRITVTHAGFGHGDEWVGQLQGHAHGWGQVLADLVLYLETGVALRRSFTWRSRIGVVTVDTPAGVTLARVQAAGAAAGAGLRAGDLLVQLGAAPLFDTADLCLALAVYQPGEEVEAVVVRGEELLRLPVTLGGAA